MSVLSGVHHDPGTSDIVAAVSCFNGSDHVGRRLLVGALHRQGWFDARTCTKNFAMTVDQLDGAIRSQLFDLSDEPRARSGILDETAGEFYAQTFTVRIASILG